MNEVLTLFFNTFPPFYFLIWISFCICAIIIYALYSFLE